MSVYDLRVHMRLRYRPHGGRTRCGRAGERLSILWSHVTCLHCLGYRALERAAAQRSHRRKRKREWRIRRIAEARA